MGVNVFTKLGEITSWPERGKEDFANVFGKILLIFWEAIMFSDLLVE